MHKLWLQSIHYLESLRSMLGFSTLISFPSLFVFLSSYALFVASIATLECLCSICSFRLYLLESLKLQSGRSLECLCSKCVSSALSSPFLLFVAIFCRSSQSSSRGGDRSMQRRFGLCRTGGSGATIAQAAGVIDSLFWTPGRSSCECVQHGRRHEATLAVCR